MFPCPKCDKLATVYGVTKILKTLWETVQIRRSLCCRTCGTRFHTVEKFAGLPRDYKLKNGGMQSWLNRQRHSITTKREAGDIKKTPRAGKKNPRGVEQT